MGTVDSMMRVKDRLRGEGLPGSSSPPSGTFTGTHPERLACRTCTAAANRLLPDQRTASFCKARVSCVPDDSVGVPFLLYSMTCAPLCWCSAQRLLTSRGGTKMALRGLRRPPLLPPSCSSASPCTLHPCSPAGECTGWDLLQAVTLSRLPSTANLAMEWPKGFSDRGAACPMVGLAVLAVVLGLLVLTVLRLLLLPTQPPRPPRRLCSADSPKASDLLRVMGLAGGSHRGLELGVRGPAGRNSAAADNRCSTAIAQHDTRQ
jgi:hypothetical protein